MLWAWRGFCALPSAPMLPHHENYIAEGFDRATKPRAAAVRKSAVAADHLRDLADISGVEDAASQSAASDVASVHSSLLFLRLPLLLASQPQKLGIGRQHLPDGLLELPPGGHPAADLCGPLRGDTIHVALPVDHVGQAPSRVALAAGTSTVGLSAARITQGQGPRELVG